MLNPHLTFKKPYAIRSTERSIESSKDDADNRSILSGPRDSTRNYKLGGNLLFA